jgi:hypothetical protein
MRYFLTIILLTGCVDATQQAGIEEAKQQLRAASVFVGDEPVIPNTIALEAIRTKFNEPSESEPAVEPEPEVSPQPAPVTPDPAGSDFIQPIPEPSITFQPVVQSSGPLATLYTSDGSFVCGGCVTQERILSTAKISLDLYQVVQVNGETAAAMGGVPRWEPYDKNRTFGGAMTAEKLQAWLDSLQVHRDGSTLVACEVIGGAVTVDTVAAALTAHLSDEAAQQPFGSLLNVDVDTPDELTAAVFALFSTGKWSSEAAGIAFEWFAESRAISDKAGTITLTPPARVSLSKWRAKWNATLNGITYDAAGRSVTMILGGAPDLTVRFQ